jgi:hypothetical protein
VRTKSLQWAGARVGVPSVRPNDARTEVAFQRGRIAGPSQASSRSTAIREAGSSRGGGTSETFGTKDAARDVAAATS